MKNNIKVYSLEKFILALGCIFLFVAMTTPAFAAHPGSTGTQFEDVSMLNPHTGVLWPGGQYGSTKPANTSEDDRGKCINCHWPYRYNDDDTTLPYPSAYPISGLMQSKYPKKWVEQYDITSTGVDPDDAEDLCYTCHDQDGDTGYGPSIPPDIKTQFEKPSHMPVKDSEQPEHIIGAVGSVECTDCHDPHQANPSNLYKGVVGKDMTNTEVWVDYNPSDPYPNNRAPQHYVCFKCHGDTYETNVGKATWNGTVWVSSLASGAIASNKRLQFQTTNSAYHPVAGPGRNRSPNLNEQLLPNLTGHAADPVGVAPIDQVISCTDCHNNEATEAVAGRARNYTGGEALGPHGSNYPSIRRANYWKDVSADPADWPVSYNPNNFNLCFRCHDKTKLAETRFYADGARTNFYGGPAIENLHWRHLNHARAVCKNCHYNIHSNYSDKTNNPDTTAWNPNTQYRIRPVGGTFTIYNDPPSAYKTHLINFSPDVLPYGIFVKPRWQIDLNTMQRTCYLVCHGTDMVGYGYRPGLGDDTP